MATNQTVAIKIAKSKDGKERVYASTPYHPAFPQKAKDLGGIWLPDGKQWAFDARDEGRVRDLCAKIFGSDGSGEALLCDVRVRLTGPKDGESFESSGTTYRHTARYFPDAVAGFWLFGRLLCERRGRDADVRLGDGVILISGGFPGSGGSARYPDLNPRPDTVLEIRDVPEALVAQEIDKHPQTIERIVNQTRVAG